MQILPPRRSVYGLRAPRVATVGRLGALGARQVHNFDPAYLYGEFEKPAKGFYSVTMEGGLVQTDNVKLGTINAEEALGPNAGQYAAGAMLATEAARLAYTGYQLLTEVPLSEVDIYLDAGSGGDVGDADALLRQANAQTTPAQKDRVAGAVEQAQAKGTDPKLVAAKASGIEANAQKPGWWDRLVENGEGIYSKCLRARADGSCVKFGLDWTAFATGGKYLTGAALLTWGIKNGKNIPIECITDFASTGCFISFARQEKGDLAKAGVPGASAPLPNPSREQVVQSWLDAIDGADKESDVDAIVEAAKRLGSFTPDEIARMEEAAKKAKAKLASKRTMLYVGLGVGAVALVALAVAVAKRR